MYKGNGNKKKRKKKQGGGELDGREIDVPSGRRDGRKDAMRISMKERKNERSINA